MFERFEVEAHGPVEQITTGKNVMGWLPMTAHCYRIGSTLIDAGAPRLEAQVVEHLDGQIEDVLLTHHHVDHVGAARQLAEQGATIHAPAGSIVRLAHRPEGYPYEGWVWGPPRAVSARPVMGEIETQDGRFRAVLAPGHVDVQVAYLEEERGWLFSGDAVLGRRRVLRDCEVLDEMLGTYLRLLELGPCVLFPGHGPVREDHRPSVERSITYYAQKAEEAHTLAEEGRSPTAIRREMLGLEGMTRYYTQANFSKQNLVDQLLATPLDHPAFLEAPVKA